MKRLLSFSQMLKAFAATSVIPYSLSNRQEYREAVQELLRWICVDGERKVTTVLINKMGATV